MSAIKPIKCKAGEVAVRMFCQGLGDCFLIGLGIDDKTTFKIVVDCGVIVGTPNGGNLINQTVSGLFDSTEGKIDALIITHEHWDHVGGFDDAQELWKKFKVGEVWLAWTENRPADTFAQQLYDQKHKDAKNLAFALKDARNKFKMALDKNAAQEAWEDSTAFLSFLGLDSDKAAEVVEAGDSPMGKTEAALNFAKSLGKNAYFMPGNVKDIGTHFQIAFLGPPHDATIKKSDDPGGKHTYKTKILGFDEDGMEDEAAYGSGPFDSSFRIEYDGLAQMKDKPSSFSLFDRYESEGENWRKIGLDASQLALNLDSATNNTSLAFALAIKGAPTRYLMFAADAQVGNWLSWDKQTYKIGGKDVIIDDIFANTVFYKVGHHGSHNATLKDRGLELMTHPNLSGFLPLDEDVAKNKKHWPMPWPALYSTLKVKMGDRLGRSDMLDPLDKSFVHAPVNFTGTDRPIYLERKF